MKGDQITLVIQNFIVIKMLRLILACTEIHKYDCQHTSISMKFSITNVSNFIVEILKEKK